MTSLEHLKGLTKEINRLENELIIKSYLVDSAVNPIGIADPEGSVIYGNKLWYNFWGYNEDDDLRDLTVYDFYKEREDVDHIIEQLEETGIYKGRIIGITKSGEEIECILICSNIKNSKGEVIGTTALFLYEDDVERLNGDFNGRSN